MFAELFSSFGQALPAPTQFVINLSQLHHRLLPLPGRGGDRRRGGVPPLVPDRERAHWRSTALSSRSPVFGDLIRKSSIARFTRTLGTLVSSGVPILDALAITARTAGNKVVERAVLATRAEHQRGPTDRRAADARARSSRRWSAR